MGSVLVFGRDPKASVRIDELARPLGFTLKFTSSLSTFAQLLEIDQFDLLLVDATWTEPSPMDFIRRGWKKNPVMIAAIFNLDAPAPDEWGATLSGVRIFSHPNALELIRRALISLSENHQKTNIEVFPILLVEDLDSPRYIITSFIQSLGYKNVLAARDGKEALKILHNKSNNIRCVITDINMPEMNGTELTKVIREDEDLKRLPVIVLTADPTSSHLVDCVRAGASGFLVKPPRKDSILMELEKAKRIVFHNLSPRLCRPEEADLLEEALNTLGRL